MRAVAGGLLEFAENFQAGHAGHQEVQQDAVGLLESDIFGDVAT